MVVPVHCIFFNELFLILVRKLFSTTLDAMPSNQSMSEAVELLASISIFLKLVGFLFLLVI
jgi:hypothetical protein